MKYYPFSFTERFSNELCKMSAFLFRCIFHEAPSGPAAVQLLNIIKSFIYAFIFPVCPFSVKVHLSNIISRVSSCWFTQSLILFYHFMTSMRVQHRQHWCCIIITILDHNTEMSLVSRTRGLFFQMADLHRSCPASPGWKAGMGGN